MSFHDHWDIISAVSNSHGDPLSIVFSKLHHISLLLWRDTAQHDRVSTHTQLNKYCGEYLITQNMI
jgi:hypothetical protein